MLTKQMLIIDDEVKIREMYRQIFDSIGYDVVTAGNALDALSFLARNKFDVVLLDINMPKVDGSILFEAMKVSHKDVKVVVSSVYSIQEQQERIKGADGYFDKSDSKDVLVSLITSLFIKNEMTTLNERCGSSINMEDLMKEFNNKHGFTLIEIIVVLIIVGILASIALPSLFANVARSRSAEGMAGLSTYKSQTEACVQAHYGTAATSCAWANLNLATSSGNFLYTFATAPSNSSYIYAIKATNSTYTSDTITLTRGGVSTNGYTCTGATNYAGVC